MAVRESLAGPKDWATGAEGEWLPAVGDTAAAGPIAE